MKAVGNWLVENKKEVTLLTLGTLFVARLIIGYLSFTNGDSIPSFLVESYFIVSVIALTVFVLSNKDNLTKFNIDRYVIYTFILSGSLVAFSFSLSLAWIITIVCSVIIWRAQLNSKLESSQTGSFLKVLLFVCVGILPEAIFKLLRSNYYSDYQFFIGFDVDAILAAISVILWNVLFEEMLFRSIAWGVLNDWQLSDHKIVLTQAVLFWFVHLDRIADKSFGLSVLIFGIWAGFLTLRSKSLTPSIATHFFHNITSRLY